MLPPLATFEDFKDRIPNGIEAGADENRGRGALADASSLIRATAGATAAAAWGESSDIPDVIVTICIQAAKRAFLNPDAVRSLAIDGDSATFAASSPDVYLTDAEKVLIRQAAQRGGLWTQSTTRGDADLPSPRDEGTMVAPLEESDPFGELGL